MKKLSAGQIKSKLYIMFRHIMKTSWKHSPLIKLKIPSERADSETLRNGSPSPVREKTKILYVLKKALNLVLNSGLGFISKILVV